MKSTTAMSPEQADTDPNPARRKVLRGILMSGCALTLPALWGCSKKDESTVPSAADVPPATNPPSDVPSPPPAPPAEAPAPDARASSSSSPKMSKEQAQYQPQPKGDQKCANCMHFVAADNSCNIVEGQIDPEAWCIVWAKQPA